MLLFLLGFVEMFCITVPSGRYPRMNFHSSSVTSNIERVIEIIYLTVTVKIHNFLCILGTEESDHS